MPADSTNNNTDINTNTSGTVTPNQVTPPTSPAPPSWVHEDTDRPQPPEPVVPPQPSAVIQRPDEVTAEVPASQPPPPFPDMRTAANTQTPVNDQTEDQPIAVPNVQSPMSNPVITDPIVPSPAEKPLNQPLPPTENSYTATASYPAQNSEPQAQAELELPSLSVPVLTPPPSEPESTETEEDPASLAPYKFYDNNQADAGTQAQVQDTPLDYSSSSMSPESPAVVPPESSSIQPQIVNTPEPAYPGMPQPEIQAAAPQSPQDTYAPPPPSFNPPPPPPPPSSPTNPDEPIAAHLTNDNSGLIKKLVFGLLALIVVGGIAALANFVLLPALRGGLLTGNGDNSPQPGITLTYWGLWEPSEALQEVFDDYTRAHPNVKINYYQEKITDYRERLQTSFTQGDAPDIFRYHNTWYPMLKNDLAPAPRGALDMNQYYPVIAKNVSYGGEVYGAPLGFDTMALYYNPGLFQKAGITAPPKSWDELIEIAKKLRVPEDTPANTGKPLQVAGVALGTTNNVEHFSDIFGLMMLQNNANLSNPSDTYTQDTLQFYTQFSNRHHVWDETLPSSVYAFATEKVGMIFAPSWRAAEIKKINPQLNFATAPVPQLPNGNVAWATYWVEGVSKRSKHTDEAWKLLTYLSSDEALTKIYTSQAKLRDFGEPYPKTTLAQSLSQDPVVGAFVQQGPYAQSWYLSSRTYDNGINDQMIKYYEDAINATGKSGSNPQVTQTLSQGVAQVLRLYNVPVQSQSSQP